MRYLILIATILITFNANAQSCKNLQEQVIEKITKANSCFDSSDCYARSFGCPFEPLDCMFSYVAHSNKEFISKIDKKIEFYTQECELPSYCSDKATIRCGNKPPILVCVDGTCKNQTQALYLNGYIPVENDNVKEKLLNPSIE